jgi:probable rRNA maturation factor
MIIVLKAVRSPVTPARVRSLIASAATVAEVSARLPAPEWDLAVRIAGDRELRRLNREFLGVDEATDVLSFPSGDSEPGAHLGDIVISWAAVGRQAAEFGHSEDSELALLAVHGFLHVLGWDHATPTEETEMSRLTFEALARSAVEIAPGRLFNPPPRG